MKNARVLFSIAIFALVFGGSWAYNQYKFGSKYTDGTHEVLYKSPIDEAQAKKVHGFLVKTGYFSGKNRISVQVVESSEAYQMKFVMKPGAWRQKQFVNIFWYMRAQALGDSLFPAEKQTVFQLCNNNLDVKKTLGPDSEPAGLKGLGQPEHYDSNRVYLMGSLTREHGQQVVAALGKANFVKKDSQVLLKLIETADEFQIHLVLNEGSWTKTSVLQAFETIYQIAEQSKLIKTDKAVVMHLCDFVFESKYVYDKRKK